MVLLPSDCNTYCCCCPFALLAIHPLYFRSTIIQDSISEIRGENNWSFAGWGSWGRVLRMQDTKAPRGCMLPRLRPDIPGHGQLSQTPGDSTSDGDCCLREKYVDIGLLLPVEDTLPTGYCPKQFSQQFLMS
jgi:hypothetical protein